MLCKNCGNEMNNGATFCNRCGMNYGTISQNLSSSNSVNPNAATVTAKKKLSTKTIVAIVCSIIAFSIASCLGVSLVIGFLVLSGDDSVIIENDNCQLGATYYLLPRNLSINITKLLML
ncbi:MAG: zinc-ribbon domain-containing protein [Ruminococcus sp.]|nr:zinc-ribbon domain-containing protein [Ruminococcus sp.]